MKWVGIALVFLYVAGMFARASHDDHFKKVAGWGRWLRFLLLMPWTFVSPL
jgi:hypothetical protein